MQIFNSLDKKSRTSIHIIAITHELPRRSVYTLLSVIYVAFIYVTLVQAAQ